MKKITKLFLLGVLLISASTAFGQNMSDMRLNEILVTNTDGYVDDYGNRSGWIELFNTSYGTVDVAGCYLTDDPNNLKKYMIPKGDVLTKVRPRQHLLFYADSLPNRGTFHINFKLNNGGEILFVSSDGRTIIDKIGVPVLPENQSYGRVMDGEGSHEPIHFMKKSMNANKKEAQQNTSGGWDILERVTPSTNNFINEGNSKSLELLDTDPTGIVMAITSMSVVFLALILLFVVFKNTGNYHIRKSAQKAMEAKGGEPVATVSKQEALKSGEVSAEIYAAIAMACHLYKIDSEAHDVENTILTINNVPKHYSPWSSKIYTLRETPKVKKQ